MNSIYLVCVSVFLLVTWLHDLASAMDPTQFLDSPHLTSQLPPTCLICRDIVNFILLSEHHRCPFPAYDSSLHILSVSIPLMHLAYSAVLISSLSAPPCAFLQLADSSSIIPLHLHVLRCLYVLLHQSILPLLIFVTLLAFRLCVEYVSLSWRSL